MEKEFREFFDKADDIYGSKGCLCLMNFLETDAIELNDGMDNKYYQIAKVELLNYLSKHNTNASNRIFGITDFVKDELVEKCMNNKNIL